MKATTGVLLAVLVLAGAYFFEVEIKFNQDKINKILQSVKDFTAQAPPPRHAGPINLFKSGEYENPTIFNSTLSGDFEQIKKQLAVALYGNQATNQVTLHTELGDVITSRDVLLQNENVYVLRSNDVWIFPGKYVGYKFVVAGHQLETLSLLPRVFKVSQYLTVAQAEAIISEAAAKEEPSTVYEGSGKASSKTRTSSTSYITYTPEFVDRAFNVTKVPKDPGFLYPDHMLQVIHYRENQHFHPHHDAFNTDVDHEAWYMKGRRNRFLTLFIYLNDVEAGGETGFVKYSDLGRFKSEAYDINDRNPCDSYAVLTVKPKQGDAVLFYDLQVGGYQEGKIEWESLHTGCGVKKGEKWACNVWMYNKPFHDEASDNLMSQWNLGPGQYGVRLEADTVPAQQAA